MREIKFRGRDKLDDGAFSEWLYGSLDLTEYRPIIRPKGGIPETVMLETIGQFTGQKDPNGVEIYEGDVVFCNTFRGVVMYNSYTASFQVVGVRGWATSLEYDKHNPFEVAGNIFDDPELKERFWAVWNQ